MKFRPLPHPPGEPFTSYHQVCDPGGTVSRWKGRFLAHGTKGAVIPKEDVDALGVENVATREFADAGFVVDEVVKADGAGRLGKLYFAGCFGWRRSLANGADARSGGG